VNVYFFGLHDDRGYDLKNYLTTTYIVGDFNSYERSLTQVFDDFLKLLNSSDLNNVGSIQGPFMPLIISISKFISNNLIPFFIFSLYLSLWCITFSLDIARNILPFLDKQLEKKLIQFNIIKDYSISLSSIELFGIILNPIFLFYVLFPASDLPFAALVLFIIWSSLNNNFTSCYFLYVLSILIRPTGLFLYPAINLILFFDYKENRKFRLFTFFLLLTITLISYFYYKGYSVVNFNDTLKFGGYGGGLSVWGLPVPGWIISKSGSLTLEINKILSILFTPFIQLISTLGIRPSYTTIFDGNSDTTLSIVKIKPYIYAFVRIIWGSIMNLPGLIYLCLIFINNKSKQLVLFLVIIFSFAFGLSSSIPLERYLFFVNPLLSIATLSCYFDLQRNLVLENDKNSKN
tara:strand:- start:3688 stop:4899 length:1212 start_codon:yes stop_codon:yes gene_type:complete